MLLWSNTHHTVTRQSFCHNMALKRTSECLLTLRLTECRYRDTEKQGVLNTESKNQNIRNSLSKLHTQKEFFPSNPNIDKNQLKKATPCDV